MKYVDREKKKKKGENINKIKFIAMRYL
ncbi:hypothetical protein SBY92_001206 [Candida maltosa Xu316]